jgi:hypothetical protein
MKLWLLEQDVNSGYDTFDSCVVSAPTYEEALAMMPRGNGGFWPDESAREDYWAPIDKVVCTQIGDALPGAVQCVWCASFNAG